MDWNLLFEPSVWPIVVWASLAYLVFVLVWRFSHSGSGEAGPAKGSPQYTLGDRLLGRSWLVPAVAAVVLVLALFMTFERQFFGPNWSDDEAVEVEHFIEAVAQYGEASTLSQKRGMSRGDWESVNALLQSSMAEAEQVSDNILEQIHPELPAMWKDKFLPGLRQGSYGLRYYTALPQKGKDTVVHYGADSLTASRGLLENWNEWFTAHKEEMMDRLE